MSGVETPFVGHSAALRLAADPPVGTLHVPLTIVSEETRDELALDAAVPYRLRVDLATLAGERPVIAVLGEVAEGVTLEISGAPAVSLGEGRVSGSFDASDACAAPGDGPMIAEIPYVVTERGKEPEPATLRGSPNARRCTSTRQGGAWCSRARPSSWRARPPRVRRSPWQVARSPCGRRGCFARL